MSGNTSIEADRTLAQIVKIINIVPIDGATNIELAMVLGWQVIIQKNQFKVGDMVIYFSIDSILDPDNINTKFLEGKRLKTRKMCNVLSQGLIGPKEWLLDYNVDLASIKEGDDVTQQMKVKKYISGEEMSLYKTNENCENSIDGNFREILQLVPKTDEPRVQNFPAILAELVNKNVIITQKFDGTSTSFIFKDGEFIVRGRNHIIQRIPNQKNTSHYLEMDTKYNIKEKMTQLNRNIAIQGETIGPKINGNRHKIKHNDFFAFNIYDIDSGKYLNYDEFESITKFLGLNTVKLVYKGILSPELLTVKALLALADEQLYPPNHPAEGIVVKSDSDSIDRISFKVISNAYLLKYKL